MTNTPKRQSDQLIKYFQKMAAFKTFATQTFNEFQFQISRILSNVKAITGSAQKTRAQEDQMMAYLKQIKEIMFLLSKHIEDITLFANEIFALQQECSSAETPFIFEDRDYCLEQIANATTLRNNVSLLSCELIASQIENLENSLNTLAHDFQFRFSEIEFNKKMGLAWRNASSKPKEVANLTDNQMLQINSILDKTSNFQRDIDTLLDMEKLPDSVATNTTTPNIEKLLALKNDFAYVYKLAEQKRNNIIEVIASLDSSAKPKDHITALELISVHFDEPEEFIKTREGEKLYQSLLRFHISEEGEVSERGFEMVEDYKKRSLEIRPLQLDDADIAEDFNKLTM